jgi:hypothetical protein
MLLTKSRRVLDNLLAFTALLIILAVTMLVHG